MADHSIFWQCIVTAQYDFRHFPQTQRIMDTYHQLIREGKTPVIIDCGGNIGLSALWLAQLFPLAHLVILEPDTDNRRMILLNTKAISSRTTILAGGIWQESGHLVITNPEAGSAAFRVVPVSSDHPAAIRAYSLPEVLQIADTEYPFIVKIDIEGSQRYLFTKNTEWVEQTPLIMLELDDWQFPWTGSNRSFFSAVSQYPFDYTIQGETIFCFRDFQALTETTDMHSN